MTEVLIIGGTSDIALACAHFFAKHRFNIQLAGRDVEYLGRIKADLEIRYEISCRIYYFEAIDFESHKELIDNLGVFPDITIWAVGYLGDQERAQRLWSESLQIIQVNFCAAVSVLNRVAELYEHEQRGTIVGISSVAGDRGRSSNYLYGASKSALSAYLSGLRQRLSKCRVHVVSVKPGFVRTKMTSDLKLPRALTAVPNTVAKCIYLAVKRKKNVVYVKSEWRYIMCLIKNIPETIFKNLRL